MLTWAQRYLKAGFSVIPLKLKSKEPLINWKEFQTRKATELEINEWFMSGLNNIGIVTGKISNLIVLDADGLSGLEYLKKNHINSNVSVITGTGKHLWFRYQDGIKNSASAIAPGIDIRGEGGFVVAPPSVHPNGKRYRWNGVVNVVNANRLPVFPTALFTATPVSHNLDTSTKPEGWISEALEEMKNGHVHNNLVSVLGKFRHHNFSIRDTITLITPFAFDEYGKPFEGLEAKVEEIWGRYEPSRPLLCAMQRGVSAIRIRSAQSSRDATEYGSIKPITISAITTGFPTLDRFFEGGVASERPFTIAARTGENKTNTGISMARHICEQDKRVLYFSTEFSYQKIWKRYIAQLQSPDEFRSHAFYVCDSFSPNLEQIEEAIREVKPDVFMFDYIQHIADEREGLTKFMQGLTFIQKKYSCQAVVLAQLNRYADFVQDGKRIEPRLSMIKGADSIGQMSSRVLLLSVTKISPEMDEIEAILDKNDSGDKGKFFLGLRKNPYKVVELI